MRRPVHYFADNTERFAMTRDMSEDGMFVVAAELLPIGSRTQFDVRLENGASVSFTGTVVRVVRGATTGFAIHFDPGAADETAIVRRSAPARARAAAPKRAATRRARPLVMPAVGPFALLFAVEVGRAYGPDSDAARPPPAAAAAADAPPPTHEREEPEPPLFVPADLSAFDDPELAAPPRSRARGRPRGQRELPPIPMPQAPSAPDSPSRSELAAQHYQNAKALLRERKVLLALEELETSLRYEPDQPLVYRAMAAANSMLGREAAVVQALERFVELAPDHRDVPRIRGYLAGQSSQ